MAEGIYPDGEGRWVLMYDAPRGEDGKRNQKRKRFKGTAKAAKAERIRLINEVLQEEFLEPSKWTVETLFKEWMKTYSEQQHEVNTYRRNECFIRVHIVPALGKVQLEKLTALQLDKFYIKLKTSGRVKGEGGLSIGTVRQIHAVITSALRWAVKKRKLKHNVALDADTLKVEATRFTPLDEVGIRQLLGRTEGTPLHLPVLLAVYTGCRQGEIAGLKWPDVDLDAGTITVCRSLQTVNRGVRGLSGRAGKVGGGLSEVKGHVREKGTKTGAPRIVPIPGTLLAELRRVKSEQAQARLTLGPIYQNEGWVVAHEDGSLRTPGSIATAFRKLVRKHGIPTHFHGLRHGYASLLGATGTSPAEAAELLGHKNVTMTHHYTHAQERRKREAVNRLDEALGRNGTEG